MAEMSSDPTCCFCYGIIQSTEDPFAMRIRVGLLSGDLNQTLYAHSTCFKERLHADLDFWWEYSD
ncbi:hypothetical protein [Streptomyces sp. NBC_01451]|uniref:hypothetical protein n=1 Tax=Streptomyces sp. NBC_01451 TaxID=2903872 RepID=UPI002E307805|nr:hypothetical protein [Streptomyces sp. NBC_01451]